MTMPSETPEPAPGRVPIMESVREGFTFIARDWRAILPVALVGALVSAPLLVWQQAALARGDIGSLLVTGLGSSLVNAPFLAAYYRRAVSRGEAPLALRVGGDEARLAGVMVLMMFVSFIVCVIAFFVILLVISALIARSGVDPTAWQGLPPADAAARLTAALGSEGRIVFFALAAALTAFMLWITARLALAAPATVAEGRALVFSTWGWTKGHALAMAACLVLVTAAGYVLTWLAGQPIGMLLEIVLGKGSLAVPGSPAIWLFAFASAFLAGVFYLPAYAGMLSYLYRGLRPAQAS